MWWWHAVLTALWGGLLALERRAFLQAMFSRPLVASTGLGLLFDAPDTGLYIGLVFELFYLGDVSMGGSRTDHETMPALCATSMAAAMGHVVEAPPTHAMWAASILLCMPMGRLGGMAEAALDGRAARYIDRARLAAVEGRRAYAGRQNLRAMWPHFTFFALATASAGTLGTVLGHLFLHLPEGLLHGLAFAWPAMGTVAAAIAVASSRARGRHLAALAGALAVVGSAVAQSLWGHAP
jgi:mannose/fructose/N-acetylgalactosamine-specific phosphotransferase system component IIC